MKRARIAEVVNDPSFAELHAAHLRKQFAPPMALHGASMPVITYGARRAATTSRKAVARPVPARAAAPKPVAQPKATPTPKTSSAATDREIRARLIVHGAALAALEAKVERDPLTELERILRDP